MKAILLTLCALVLVVGYVAGAPSVSTTDVKKSEPIKETPMIETPEKMKQHAFRTGRQIGYGGLYGNTVGQLQGISSGYGYGYNNAVGLGGLGQSAGTNLGLSPGLGFYGRR